MNRPKQIPGKLYTFIKRATGEEDTGFLPRRIGESNSFAFWHKYEKRKEKNRPGCWQSKKFIAQKNANQLNGTGPQGLRGRMIRLLKNGRWTARRGGYKPPTTTPEMMVTEWISQNGKCIACLLPLELLNAHYDHEHTTGDGRGFINPSCNILEGLLRKLPKANREHLLLWVQDVIWLEGVDDVPNP